MLEFIYEIVFTNISFKETYKPKRVFKKPGSFAEGDEETQVQSTLLEYGQRYGVGKTVKEETKAKEKAMTAGLVKVDESEETEDEEARIKSLMEGMSEADIQQVEFNISHKYHLKKLSSEI